MNERRVCLHVAGVDQLCLEQGQENEGAKTSGQGSESRMKGRKRRWKNKMEPTETHTVWVPVETPPPLAPDFPGWLEVFSVT